MMKNVILMVVLCVGFMMTGCTYTEEHSGEPDEGVMGSSCYFEDGVSLCNYDDGDTAEWDSGMDTAWGYWDTNMGDYPDTECGEEGNVIWATCYQALGAWIAGEALTGDACGFETGCGTVERSVWCLNGQLVVSGSQGCDPDESGEADFDTDAPDEQDTGVEYGTDAPDQPDTATDIDTAIAIDTDGPCPCGC